MGRPKKEKRQAPGDLTPYFNLPRGGQIACEVYLRSSSLSFSNTSSPSQSNQGNSVRLPNENWV